MGRAEGFSVDAGNATAPRRRGQLSVIQGGAEPGRWTETSLERLIRALELRATGFRRYEVSAAEAQWPVFPASMLVASAVVAAERSFPGVSVVHMSCSFGRPPRADRPVEVAVSEVHIGRSCTTARLTFLQRGASHGEATVLLRSCPTAVSVRRPRGSTAAARSRLAAAPPLAPAAVIGPRAPTPHPDGRHGTWSWCPPRRRQQEPRVPGVVARSWRSVRRDASAGAAGLSRRAAAGRGGRRRALPRSSGRGGVTRHGAQPRHYLRWPVRPPGLAAGRGSVG